MKKHQNPQNQVQFIIGEKEWQWRKKMDMGHDSNGPSLPKNWGLPNGRNIEHTVRADQTEYTKSDQSTVHFNRPEQTGAVQRRPDFLLL